MDQTPYDGPERRSGGCRLCGPGGVPNEDADPVSGLERSLWQVMTDGVAAAGRPWETRRASDVVRRTAAAETAAEDRVVAREELAAHLDHLLAWYGSAENPPFWFRYGIGLPTGRLDVADWASRSQAMLAHRRGHGITDPLRPLGRRPADGTAEQSRWVELMQHPKPTW